MESLDKAFDKVYEIQSKIDEVKPSTIFTHLAKLTEETGELATDLLKLDGYKASDEKPEDINKNLEEEVADVLIMALVISHQVGVPRERLLKIMDKKLKKWVKKKVRKLREG